MPPVRRIVPGAEENRTRFPSNKVKTSQYTPWTFLPVNLYEQFSEPPNLYFLLVGLLQIIPAVSTTAGVPTMYLPLLFIILVSGTRAAIEDWRRHKADVRAASRPVWVLDRNDQRGWIMKPSGDLVVGDIVRVTSSTGEEGQPQLRRRRTSHRIPLPGSQQREEQQQQPDNRFPADLLFLASSHPKGHAFVETSSIDGETNLKAKTAVSAIHEKLIQKDVEEHPGELLRLDFTVECQEPNPQINEFSGRLQIRGTSETVQLTATNLLLRDTELRNTPFIYGLVVYTGKDTKIRKNIESESTQQLLKKSGLLKMVDQFLMIMLGLEFLLCLTGAVIASISFAQFQKDWYLQLSGSPAKEGILRFFTWFIILSQMVPISLIVSTELVKTAQAMFIQWDPQLQDDKGRPASIRTSVVNEDMGQISYLFCDKTGTLTQNKMQMRVCFVRRDMFGDPKSEIAKRIEERRAAAGLMDGTQHAIKRVKWTQRVAEVDDVDETEQGNAGEEEAVFSPAHKRAMLRILWGDGHDSATGRGETKEAGPEIVEKYGNEERKKLTRMFLTHMALSNTITPIKKERTIEFQSSSPDELAMCKWARYMGFCLESRGPETVLAVDKQGFGDDKKERETYRHLATLDFNSKRKRLTLIYEREGTVYVMCKGADSAVLPLVKEPDKEEQQVHKDILSRLVEMAQNGLRTMLVVSAELPKSWWDNEAKSIWDGFKDLPETGEEKGHTKGECSDECRICKGCLEIERKAGMTVLGATALEDRLQELVPEAIQDFLLAGIKVWMLTGDKRETAKNIAIACNLIDPEMEKAEVPTVQKKDISRLIYVTGQWGKSALSKEELQELFKILDRKKDGYIDPEELRTFLMLVRAPGVEQEETFQAIMDSVDGERRGKVTYEQFERFCRSVRLTEFKAVQADVREGLLRIEQIGEEYLHIAPVSMILEGSAFAQIFPSSSRGSEEEKGEEEEEEKVTREERKALQDDFFKLATKCKSVVCCRLTPSQKGKLVTEIHKRTGAITLAIGDGGNDAVMIKAASVGVGIAGEEGTAAARAADVTIGQFRALHDLLFVHGFLNYRRTSKLILFIFWKVSLVGLPMFFYGFISAFSGQQLFNDPIYQLYNVIFTAIPVLVLGVFDQALSRQTLQDNPRTYGSQLRRPLLTTANFLWWIARAIIHAAIIWLICYYALAVVNVASPSMIDHNLWFFSTTIFTAVVTLSNVRILLDMSSLTWIHHVAIWGSMLAYIATLAVLTVQPTWNPDLYWVFFRMLMSPTVWLTVFAAVMIPLMLDAFAIAVGKALRPSYIQLLHERELLKSRTEMSTDKLVSEREERREQLLAPGPSTKEEAEAMEEAKGELEPAGPAAGLAAVAGKEAAVEAALLSIIRLRNMTGGAFEASPAARFLKHAGEVTTVPQKSKSVNP